MKLLCALVFSLLATNTLATDAKIIGSWQAQKRICSTGESLISKSFFIINENFEMRTSEKGESIRVVEASSEHHSLAFTKIDNPSQGQRYSYSISGDNQKLSLTAYVFRDFDGGCPAGSFQTTEYSRIEELSE